MNRAQIAGQIVTGKISEGFSVERRATIDGGHFYDYYFVEGSPGWSFIVDRHGLIEL